ncbi:hypothetical protein HPT25_26830 [Bacillus sp. BRMEA1]|uniref:hypothetical protein n=1 Tax=Neobacillus endophyticus TaxID=2738405 RepID=UPI0015679C40|nr:hypothetical protein [Neobacillus endophyticus]NRD80943.1 hypothetical protein [Neobacillus endophyticus]
MKTSVPCPNCQIPISLDDFEDFSTPFTMKCPHCKAKLKETKVTPFLLLGMFAVIPIFIYLTAIVKNILAGIIPVIEKIPTTVVFLGVLYPIFALYERINGLIMFNKGNLHLKHNNNREEK